MTAAVITGDLWLPGGLSSSVLMPNPSDAGGAQILGVDPAHPLSLDLWVSQCKQSVRCKGSLTYASITACLEELGLLFVGIKQDPARGYMSQLAFYLHLSGLQEELGG